VKVGLEDALGLNSISGEEIILEILPNLESDFVGEINGVRIPISKPSGIKFHRWQSLCLNLSSSTLNCVSVLISNKPQQEVIPAFRG
jgi:hypothetical protein